MSTKRTRTVPSICWELYCPKKTRTRLSLADSSNRPSEQLPLLFCCFFVHGAWRAEPACRSVSLAPLVAQPNYSAKSSGLMAHLVTGTQALPALSVKLGHSYPCTCLSVCLPVSPPGPGLQDLCRGFSLTKQEKYQIRYISRTVHLVAGLSVQINICSCIYQLLTKFSVTISTAVDINCVVIDHGYWQSNVSAHKSGKDLTRDQGTPSGSVLVLARCSLMPVEKTVTLLRFVFATVAEGKQTRQKIQMYL